MSKKYVIEIKPEYEDTTRGIMVLGAKDSNLFVDTLAVEELEELNSDYINEHYGSLQDDAYQRGLEEGKKATFGLVADASNAEYQKGFEGGKAIHEKGCEGCEWEGTPIDACERCCNNYMNLWKAKDDKIEVGDEVTTHWAKGIVTVADYGDDIFYVMFSDGSCGKREVNTLKKTGRHFDIQSILEAMRND